MYPFELMIACRFLAMCFLLLRLPQGSCLVQKATVILAVIRGKIQKLLLFSD
jgi:hypothetical protein